MGLRDKILQANDVKEELVEVPEWECQVLVRGMTAKQRARFLQDGVTDKGQLRLERIFPDIVMLTAYDPESKELIFEASDREAISMKSGQSVDRIVSVALRLSGMGNTAVADATKNSSPGSDESISESQNSSVAQ